MEIDNDSIRFFMSAQLYRINLNVRGCSVLAAGIPSPFTLHNSIANIERQLSINFRSVKYALRSSLHPAMFKIVWIEV